MQVDGVEYTQIPNHPDYFVSVSGAVISMKWKRPVLKTVKENVEGYLQVKLDNQWRGLHRVLATTFIPNPKQLAQVNHINGVKADNRIENLEWVTHQDNLAHAMLNGLHASPPTPIIGVNIETGERLLFNSQADAGRAGFAQANVWKCLHGERSHVKGYRWTFA